MLVRPLMINLKMTVQDDCAISACNHSPLPIKALTPCLSWGGGEAGLWIDVCHPPPSPFHQPVLFIGFWGPSGQTQKFLLVIVSHLCLKVCRGCLFTSEKRSEDEVVERHHWLSEHETLSLCPGSGQGQGSLACCNPWGHKELDRTEWPNKKKGQIFTMAPPHPHPHLWLSHLSLEKEMATHSSILAWKIPWTEEPGRSWSMGVTKNSQTWLNDEDLSYSSLPCSSHLAGADWPLHYNFHPPSTLPPQRLYLAHSFSKWCLGNAFTSFKSLLNFDSLNRAYTCHTI